MRDFFLHTTLSDSANEFFSLSVASSIDTISLLLKIFWVEGENIPRHKNTQLRGKMLEIYWKDKGCIRQLFSSVQFSSVQSLSRVRLFVTP